MEREQIIRMAQQAGFEELFKGGNDWICFTEEIERFAALVAAAKDAEHAKKLKNDIHSCGPTCTRYTCVAVREAVEAEREACAMWAWSSALTVADTETADKVLAAIRSRGEAK